MQFVGSQAQAFSLTCDSQVPTPLGWKPRVEVDAMIRSLIEIQEEEERLMVADKSVLITGVSGGLGGKMARSFSGKGWAVYGLSRREPDIEDSNSAGTSAISLTRALSRRWWSDYQQPLTPSCTLRL